MNSKYKLLCVILACVFVLSSLSSCVGVGDGALFDDIKTSEPSGERTVCTLELYTSNKSEKLDEAMLEGAEAEELLEYLSSAATPNIEAVDDDCMGYNYMVVSFEQYDKDGNKIPNFDTETGAMSVFYVRDNDNVDQGNMLLSFGRSRLGYLEGAYDKLFGYFADYGGSMGYFCTVSTSYAPHASVRAAGEKVRDMYLLLSEFEFPSDTDIPRNGIETSYVMLSFWGAADADYYVYSDDYVEAFNAEPFVNSSLFKPLGYLDGAYEKAIELFEDSLNMFTEEELDAGVKLNCLQVKMKMNISRIFYLSDFEDIGGIYLKHLTLSDGYYAWVYFESCTHNELKKKISAIEKLDVVDDVSEIFIVEKILETAFAE